MSLMRFCSHCWAENGYDTIVCDRCGASLTEAEAISSEQRFLRALHHPEPLVREMAALLLGLRTSPSALSVLIARLFEETDVCVLCALSKVLGQGGDDQAARALVRRLEHPNTFRVALALVEALDVLAQRGCWQALRALKAPPSVSERVAEVIAVKRQALNQLYL